MYKLRKSKGRSTAVYKNYITQTRTRKLKFRVIDLCRIIMQKQRRTKQCLWLLYLKKYIFP